MANKTKRADTPEGSRTWAGWALFSPRNKDGKHACKLCQKLITYSNSTSSFKKHLQKKHSSHWDELKEKKDEIAAAAAAHSVPSSSPSILELLDPSKIQIRKEATNRLVKPLQQDLVRFIVGDVRPFHAVEGTFLSPASSFYLLYT